MNSVQYRPDIQGMRAIAVIVVMVFHLNPDWMPGGFIGVDVFFVISGFLIASILIRRKTQPNFRLGSALTSFYLSRIKRIAPAYFMMLVAVALMASVFFIPQDFEIFIDSLEKSYWFDSNRYFADFGSYFAPSSYEQPLLHTWSLAIELKFYLLAPLFVLMLPLRQLKFLVAMLFVGLTLMAEYRLRVLGIEQSTYYSLYSRLPEFFAGIYSAIFISETSVEDRNKPWVSVLGLGLIILAAIIQPFLGHFPGIPALLPVVGSVLILVSTYQNTTVNRLLSSKALVWIGALSYSLYLWHWPVLAFLRYYTGAEILDVSFSLLFFLLTLLFSFFSYYAVERSFQSKKMQKKQIFSLAVLVGAVLVTSQTMAKVNEMFSPGTLPAEYLRYADPDNICHGKIVGNCLQGDLSSEEEILVLGDSHAAMLNHFFDHLGKELDFKARIITSSSCVTIPEFDYHRIAEWAQEPCRKQIDAADNYNSGVKKIFIVGKWSRHSKVKDFMKAMASFLESSQGKEIYLLSQVPMFEEDVTRSFRLQGLGFPVELNVNVDYVYGNSAIEELSGEYQHVKFLDFTRVNVFDTAPLYLGELIYKDEHHINEVGAKIYANAVKPHMSIFLSE